MKSHLNTITIKWSLVATFFLLIITSMFYWFELRPVSIKKKCSWTTYVQPEKPPVPGITQVEADKINAENKAKDLAKRNELLNKPVSALGKLWLSLERTPVTARAFVPAEPAKTLIRAATEAEYKECLRHNGI
jgi:hypothetical protein